MVIKSMTKGHYHTKVCTTLSGRLVGNLMGGLPNLTLPNILPMGISLTSCTIVCAILSPTHINGSLNLPTYIKVHWWGTTNVLPPKLNWNSTNEAKSANHSACAASNAWFMLPQVVCSYWRCVIGWWINTTIYIDLACMVRIVLFCWKPFAQWYCYTYIVIQLLFCAEKFHAGLITHTSLAT